MSRPSRSPSSSGTSGHTTSVHRQNNSSTNSNSPWSTATVAPEARSERQQQLEKLLAALERKKAQGGDGHYVNEEKEKPNHNSSRPTPTIPEPQHHASTASSAARAAAAASAAALAAGEAAAAAKKKLMQARGSPNGSRLTPNALPSPPQGDAQAREYKAQLLEARGRDGAKGQAARGAAAVERGASVNARGDMSEMLLNHAGSARSTYSVTPSSLPSNTSTFMVASGGSMEDRAMLRAFQKQQIAEAKAQAEERRRLEKEQKERGEQEQIEAVKRAEIQRKKDVKRLEREAEQAKMRAAELESQKALLSAMHHQRARLVFFGWAPWRRLVEAVRIRSQAMRAHASLRASKRFFRRWIEGMKITKQQKLEREQRKLEKAGRYHLRRMARHALRQWFRVVLKRRRDGDAKEKYHLRSLLTRSFRAFKTTCALVKQQRQRKLHQLEPRILDLALRSTQRHAWALWIRAVELGRETKKQQRKKEQVKERVGGWLEEFRAQKARDRGEYSAAGSSFTTGSSSYDLPTSSIYSSTSHLSSAAPSSHSSLSVDVPGSNYPRTSAVLSPSKYSSLQTGIGSPTRSSSSKSPTADGNGLRSPSKYSFANSSAANTSTVASPRHTCVDAALSPSRYSALDHPSAAGLSPKSLSGLSSASSNHAGSYESFISSLSPRAAEVTRAVLSPRSAQGSTAAVGSPPAVSASKRDALFGPLLPASSATSAYFSLSSPRGSHSIVSPTRGSANTAADEAVPTAARPDASSGRSYFSSSASPLPSPTTSNTAPSGLKPALSPTSKVNRAKSAGSKRSVAVAAPTPVLSGSNLSATQIATKKVTFESGVGGRPAASLSATTKPVSTTVRPSSAYAPAPVFTHQPTNFCLIQAAKAKAMELDAIDDAAGSGSTMFPFAVPSAQSSSSSPSAYDVSMDDDSSDAFGKLLTRTYQPAVTKITRPSSSPLKRTGSSSSSNSTHFDQEAELDSARSDHSGMSITSLSSNQGASQGGGTWSSQHANPSVSLAAARAARREQAAKR